MVFWDVTLCGLVGRYQHFAESCCLCLQGREYSSTLKIEAAGFFDMLLPLRNTSQKTVVFIIFIAVEGQMSDIFQCFPRFLHSNVFCSALLHFLAII